MDTVHDYVRGWVDAHFAPSDPIVSKEEIVKRLLASLPFDPDRECDDWTRETLTDTLHTPTTPLVEIIKEECEEQVDAAFADIVAPYKAQDTVAQWNFLDAPDDEVPWGMTKMIRKRYKRGWERGNFDLDVRLYEAGKLREVLEEERS